MTGLFVAKNVAGAPYFQVFHGDLVAGAEGGVFHDGAQALPRLGVEGKGSRDDKVGPGLAVGAPDAASQLVEVGEAEALGVVNYYRVDVRHVYAAFHDHGADKNVVLAFHEIFDDFLKIFLWHLPVTHGDPGVRQELLQAVSFRFYRFNSVVEVEDLAVAEEFSLDGFLDYGAALFYERRLDGQAVFGRSIDDRHVP